MVIEWGPQSRDVFIMDSLRQPHLIALPVISNQVWDKPVPDEVASSLGDLTDSCLSLSDDNGVTHVKEDLQPRLVPHVFVHLTYGRSTEKDKFAGPAFLESLG